MRNYLVRWLALVLAANAGVAWSEENTSIIQELNLYYEKGTSPAWSAAVKNLTSDNQEQRTSAAKYLVALLQQAQTDELSGKAPWRATPYWGSNGENLARNLREAIANELAKTKASSDTLLVLRWYFDHEKVAHFQETVLSALDKATGKEVDELRISLLQPAHKNSVIVQAVLRQIGDHKSPLPDKVLAALCDHYRPAVRKAARDLNKKRGGADPGPFDAAKAMQRPEIAKLMSEIGALLDSPASTDALFVKVASKTTYEKRTNTSTTLGWLVKDDGDSWVVQTPFGQREKFDKETKIKRCETEIVTQSSWEKYSIEEEVKRVADIRGKGDPNFKLSERGGLTGQFEGHGVSIYEIMLAHWLYTSKKYDLAAQVFLPALDTMYEDRHLIKVVRHSVGTQIGYRMLVAFAGERDFIETQRLAKAIVDRYPDTIFHEYAVRLAKEMLRRQDDFKSLKLPTPAEWAQLKKLLTREEQIRFLCERMRLLNCFQMGQPGGYSIREKQFAEPCGISPDAAWGMSQGTTHVINPYVELMGGSEGYWEYDEKQKSKGMELKVADIAILAPYLRDDWHLLCISFWRDFHPDRTLDTTRVMFAGIIDNLAKKELSQPFAMKKMTDDEIDTHVKSIINWSKANSIKSEADLLWEPLNKAVEAGAYFSDLPNVESLVKIKDKRLGPVLTKYLNEYETKGRRPNPHAIRFQGMPSDATFTLRDLLRYSRRYDPALFKEAARKHTKNQDDIIRLLCAYILFEGGEVDEGRKVLADLLENSKPNNLYDRDLLEMVEILIKEGSDTSRQTARLIFKNKHYPEIRDEWVRVSIVNQCAQAGIGDGYLSYLPLLDIKGNSIGDMSYSNGTVVGELIAKEIIEKLAPKDPEIIRINAKFPKAADQIAPLKEWLKEKAKAAGSKKDIQPKDDAKEKREKK